MLDSQTPLLGEESQLVTSTYQVVYIPHVLYLVTAPLEETL